MRVTYSKAAKPFICASKKATRYAICDVAVVRHREEHYLAATNGSALSMVQCDVTDAADGVVVVPKAVAKEASKGGRAGLAAIEIDDKTATAPASGLSMPLPDGRFPDVDGVLKTPTSDGLSVLRIAINAKLLAELAQAIGSDEVVLTVHTSEIAEDGARIPGPHPIRVEPVAHTPHFGAIMPLTDAKEPRS